MIAFDASFQGASGGEPRCIEDPTQRVKDISHVIDRLVTLPYVNADRIGIIGVCGGGAYSINAATTERRIKAVASITGVNFGRLIHEAFSNYDPRRSTFASSTAAAGSSRRTCGSTTKPSTSWATSTTRSAAPRTVRCTTPCPSGRFARCTRDFPRSPRSPAVPTFPAGPASPARSRVARGGIMAAARTYNQLHLPRKRNGHRRISRGSPDSVGT